MPKKNELIANVNNSNVQAPLFTNEIVLTKESNEVTVKSYFEGVLKLSQSANEYPVNLDEVWPLAYVQKVKAVASLKKNFIEGVDYVSLSQIGKQKQGRGGHNEITYMLSTSCLEYFIARKVRPVFEVYRQVFHKVAVKKGITYTEKQYSTMQNSLMKRIEKLNEEIKIEKSRTKAVESIKKQESELKNSCFYFLLTKHLYNEWHEYHTKKEEERVFKELEEKRKAIEALPYELPF